MAFTPEQIAKAFAGAQGDIYEVFQQRANQEAKQTQLERAYAKQQLDAERKERAERNAALNDVLTAQRNANLATGTKLDELYNQKSMEIYQDAFNAENAQLYKDNLPLWKQQVIPKLTALKSQEESVASGLKKVDEYIAKKNQELGGALNVPAVRNAIIDGLAFDANNKVTGSLNAEDATLDAILSGHYDFKNKKPIDSGADSGEYAADFYDPTRTENLVVTKFKPDMVQPIPVKYRQNGILMNDIYKMPSYYKVVEGQKDPVLDVVSIKGKDGGEYTVASENMKQLLTKEPISRMAIQHHARMLKDTPEGQEAFTNLDKNQFNDYVIADFSKKLPKPFKEETRVDPNDKELFDRMTARARGDKEDKTKDSLDYLMSLYSKSYPQIGNYPTPSKANYSEQNLPSGVDMGKLHDITSKSGSDLLKDASNISFKIWKDETTGQDYFSVEETKGANSVQTALSKEADRKGWKKGHFYKVPSVDWYFNFPSTSGRTDTRTMEKTSRDVKAGSTAPVTATAASVTTPAGSINWKELSQKNKTMVGPKKKIDNQSTNVENDDEWINTILDFEDTKGSRLGKPMLYNGERNFGFNKYSDELIKIKDIGKRKQRAIELFKKDILPQVKHLPFDIRKRAADLIYNGGQDPRTFLIYAAKGADSVPKDITERQKYWGQAYDKKEIDKLWNDNKDLVEKKLKDPEFVDRLDEIRSDYYNRLSDKEAYNNSWIYRMKIFNKQK